MILQEEFTTKSLGERLVGEGALVGGSRFDLRESLGPRDARFEMVTACSENVAAARAHERGTGHHLFELIELKESSLGELGLDRDADGSPSECDGAVQSLDTAIQRGERFIGQARGNGELCALQVIIGTRSCTDRDRAVQRFRSFDVRMLGVEDLGLEPPLLRLETCVAGRARIQRALCFRETSLIQEQYGFAETGLDSLRREREHAFVIARRIFGATSRLKHGGAPKQEIGIIRMHTQLSVEVFDLLLVGRVCKGAGGRTESDQRKSERAQCAQERGGRAQRCRPSR